MEALPYARHMLDDRHGLLAVGLRKCYAKKNDEMEGINGIYGSILA